ncbi:pentapeptide repeat-containing protein [Streptomyces syringium]|uniref:pentapeptide repeat-containing protein n=1 Tax=Streptomyces syringium TaxID=76729 RepID=UPI0034210199
MSLTRCTLRPATDKANGAPTGSSSSKPTCATRWPEGCGSDRLTAVLLQEVNLGSAELHEVDATGANLRGARLNGAFLDTVRLQGADPSGATVNEAPFEMATDRGAVVEGLTGTLFGPVTVVDDADGLREFYGARTWSVGSMIRMGGSTGVSGLEVVSRSRFASFL